MAAGANLMFWAPSPMTVANTISLNGVSGNPDYPALNHDGGGGRVAQDHAGTGDRESTPSLLAEPGKKPAVGRRIWKVSAGVLDSPATPG